MEWKKAVNEGDAVSNKTKAKKKAEWKKAKGDELNQIGPSSNGVPPLPAPPSGSATTREAPQTPPEAFEMDAVLGFSSILSSLHRPQPESCHDKPQFYEKEDRRPALISLK